MSHETFIIIQSMDLKNIETQLALQCAPLITGLKISNLFTVAKENEELVCAFLKKNKISYHCLVRTEKKVVFLLFNRRQLEQYLSQQEARDLLNEEGYTELNFDKVLRTFQQRYQDYMKGKQEFPHEMGIMLGYPIEDVRGFIQHRGKNFLYSGYWKVYGNEQEKILLFQKFEQAKETVIRMLSNGTEMPQIIKLYREQHLQYAAG